MGQLSILSPLSGQVWPLERVPDPVFAQKMVGDGLSIDPTDALLVAGCDGEVVALHAAGHGRANLQFGVDATSIKDCGNKMKQTLQMLEIGQKAQLLRTASNNNGPGR